jgi:hypothetical protein
MSSGIAPDTLQGSPVPAQGTTAGTMKPLGELLAEVYLYLEQHASGGTGRGQPFDRAPVPDSALVRRMKLF